MRAAPLVEAGTFDLEDRARPAPGRSEVLVEVSEVGICGSDLHWYEHGRMGDRSVEEPLVLGHESAGTVVEVGTGVADLSVGDRVAIEPGVPCRECQYCREGTYNLCRSVEFMATPGTDGALREFVAWPSDFVHLLPDGVSTREGALCEPVSVGVHAVKRADVGPGDTVAVMGAGPIGLLAADAARSAGASVVAVVDIVASKLDRALDRGADVVVDSRGADVAAVVREQTDEGVDVAIEATGAPPAIASVLDVPKRDGTVVLVGLAPDAEVPVDTFDLVRRQVDVRGSYRFANTYPTAISLIAHDTVDGTGLVDFDMPLDRVSDAFERATQSDVVKGMVSFD